jgi:hypothetical protein
MGSLRGKTTLKGKKRVISDIILAIGSLGCFFLLLSFGILVTSVFSVSVSFMV